MTLGIVESLESSVVETVALELFVIALVGVVAEAFVLDADEAWRRVREVEPIVNIRIAKSEPDRVVVERTHCIGHAELRLEREIVRYPVVERIARNFRYAQLLVAIPIGTIACHVAFDSGHLEREIVIVLRAR